MQIKELFDNKKIGMQLCLFYTFKQSRKSRNGKNARFEFLFGYALELVLSVVHL